MFKYKKNQHLLVHILELRKKLINCLIVICIVFISLVFFSNKIYKFISEPLIKCLPIGASMIATDITAPFFIPIKLVFIITIFITFPFILYQIWSFLLPALNVNEKKFLLPTIFLSLIFFYLGIVFSYYIIFPIAFKFFIETSPNNILISVDIHKYLDFVITMFISFGISFEIPIITFLSCYLQITSIKYLKSKRPYVFVISFILGMLLTPPDIISQTLLAIPLYFLFEIGLFFSNFVKNK